MPDQLPEQIKKERCRELIELGKKHRTEYMQHFLGQEKTVLFEEMQTIAEEEYWVGHTMEYLKVGVKTNQNLENKMAVVKVKNILQEEILVGEIGNEINNS